MNALTSHPLLIKVADDLASHGWSQQNVFMPTDLTAELAKECRLHHEKGNLQPAAVGRGDEQQIKRSIRGDAINWIEPGDSLAIDRYLRLMKSIQQTLNQHLFLGLDNFECHFARYPVGAFYAKHLDRFQDNDLRVVSSVLYLNEGWLPEYGGELRLHLGEQRYHDILPRAGTMVFFMSGDWVHEVLPATRERLSLTGWFRRYDSSLFAGGLPIQQLE